MAKANYSCAICAKRGNAVAHLTPAFSDTFPTRGSGPPLITANPQHLAFHYIRDGRKVRRAKYTHTHIYTRSSHKE